MERNKHCITYGLEVLMFPLKLMGILPFTSIKEEILSTK